jgi:hypothetical protein
MKNRMEKRASPEDIERNASFVLSDQKRFDWLRMKLEAECRKEGISPDKEHFEESLNRYAKRLLVVRGLLQFELRNDPPDHSRKILEQLIEAVKRNQTKPISKQQKAIEKEKQGNLI